MVQSILQYFLCLTKGRRVKVKRIFNNKFIWVSCFVILLTIMGMFFFNNSSEEDDMVTVTDPNTFTYEISDKYLAVFSRLAYTMKVGEWQQLADYKSDYDKQIIRMRNKSLITEEQFNDLSSSWSVHNIFYDPNYSFEAISFYNRSKNIMVLSYRGTEMGDKLDLGIDLFQVFMGKNTVAANLAKEAFEETYGELLDKKKRNIKFIVTGHSLGGALAQEVALQYFDNKAVYQEIADMELVTFNSPGIANNRTDTYEVQEIANHFKYYITSKTIKEKRLDPISSFNYNELYFVKDENVNIISLDEKQPTQTIGQFLVKNNLTKKQLTAKKNVIPFFLNPADMKSIHNISEIVKYME